MNVVYKTNIGCSFIQEMVENYCPQGEIHLGLLFTEASKQAVNICIPPSAKECMSIMLY